MRFRDTSLQYFGRQGEDRQIILLTELSGHRPKDTGALGGLVFLDDDGCVLIELDVRAVCAVNTVHASDYDSLNDVTLLDHTAGCSLLNSANYDIADVCLTTTGAAQNTDAKELLCTGVVGNLHPRFLLNHG